MKKVLSLALVLTMLLAIVPFSAFSTMASADAINTDNNIAFDKPFEVSVTNKGIVSAYHPIKCNGSVTDGKLNDKVTSTNLNNNSWLAVQNYTNCFPVNGSLGYEAEIIIDLGDIYDIGEVRVHYANGDFKLSDGYMMTSDIQVIDVYTSIDRNGEFIPFGQNEVGDRKGVNWASAAFGRRSARYVKVTVWLNDATTNVIYGLIDEVEVFPYDDYEITYTNYAKNANYKVLDLNGKVINPTRGYTGKLNDGIYDAPLVSYNKNPLTGQNNCNDGKWFGLFDNDATTEQNCAAGVAYIWFDLGAVRDINSIQMFAAYGYAPVIEMAYYSVDNVNYEALINTLPSMDVMYEYGAWWDYTQTFRGRYVVLKVYVEGYWGIFNEIAIYGHQTTNVAKDKSYYINNLDVPEFYFARGYNGNLTDGISDVALISYLPNPETGKNNCNDGKYFGFFNNPYAPEERNVWDGSCDIVIDLEQLCEISQVKVFFAAGYECEAIVTYSTDGVYYGDESSLNELVSGKNGNWLSNSRSTYARYVKIEFVYYNAIWTILSEIEVHGNPIA